ncbi:MULTISPECIES: hypothetical protein [unclassified Microbulbifer]|nr:MULTISPECIES: hypothetical protein [unclassified Microbulbifer]
MTKPTFDMDAAVKALHYRKFDPAPTQPSPAGRQPAQSSAL